MKHYCTCQNPDCGYKGDMDIKDTADSCKCPQCGHNMVRTSFAQPRIVSCGMIRKQSDVPRPCHTPHTLGHCVDVQTDRMSLDEKIHNRLSVMTTENHTLKREVIDQDKKRTIEKEVRKITKAHNS